MSAASVPLIEALAAQYAGLDAAVLGPDALVSARAAALDALQADGLPGPRDEAWRYTPLRAMARHAPQACAVLSMPEADLGLGPTLGPRLVLVNGQFHASASRLEGLPTGVRLMPLSAALSTEPTRTIAPLARSWSNPADWYARANTAIAHEGLLLRIDDGVVMTTPIECIHVILPDGSGAETASHTRMLVELGAGASLVLHERWIGVGAGRHLATHVSQIHLRAGSTMKHMRLQSLAAEQQLFARSDLVLARDARCARLDLELGSGVSRHDLGIDMQGHGASVESNGVMLGRGQAHIDTRMRLDHQVGETTSSMVWRGLARDRSKLSFHGGIHIREGADGSEAALSNKNLLLSEHAEVNTQPVLEIDADEVKAAHGATVGRLDPTALFYLRSRGLPPLQARDLLTEAFCMEPLLDWDESIRSVLNAALASGVHHEVQA